MSAPPEVTCVGEAIVDFISARRRATLSSTPGFLKCAGGSAANIAVGLARLGVRTAFAGMVGDDPFGSFLRRELRQARVDVRMLRSNAAHKTRLAFVALHSGGDRSFAFWEQEPADVQLRPQDINRRRLRASRVVHLSSFLLLDEPARSTAIALASWLQKRGRRVSFDPNLRLSLWKSRRLARELHLKVILRSEILRLNAEEASFLTGRADVRSASAKLLEMGPSIVVVTRGAAGCHFRTAAASGDVPGFPVRSIDATGCGDAFLAAFLFSLLRTGERIPPSEDMRSACRFANAAGALTSMKHGVFPALPRRPDVERFLRARRG